MSETTTDEKDERIRSLEALEDEMRADIELLKQQNKRDTDRIKLLEQVVTTYCDVLGDLIHDLKKILAPWKK